MGDSILCVDFVNWFISEFHPKSVLDVGSGPAFFEQHMREVDPNIFVASLDISSVALSEKNAVNLIVATMKNLPFHDRSFDMINAGGVLEHVPYLNIHAVLDEFERVAERKVCFMSMRDILEPVSDDDEHILIASRDWWIAMIGTRRNWLVGANECRTRKNCYKTYSNWTKVNWID